MLLLQVLLASVVSCGNGGTIHVDFKNNILVLENGCTVTMHDKTIFKCEEKICAIRPIIYKDAVYFEDARRPLS